MRHLIFELATLLDLKVVPTHQGEGVSSISLPWIQDSRFDSQKTFEYT